jgi:hypothetical protein
MCSERIPHDHSSDLLSLLTASTTARKAPYHRAHKTVLGHSINFVFYHASQKILTPREELELIKNLIRSHKEKPPPPARLTRFAARTESVEMEKSSFDTHTCARMILYLAPGPNWCEMIRRYRSNAINSPSAYRTRRIAAAKTNAKTLKAVLYLYIYIALRIHHA